MKSELYNQKAEKIGTIDIPEKIFGKRWQPQLVHQVLVGQMANSRKPIAHAKDRSEVRGGGRKPWRQKGTGRARHGSIRSPIWKGGGVTHGPNKNRNFGVKINKKMRQAAIFSVLSKKYKDGEVKFIDSLSFEPAKTKIVLSFIKTFFNDRDKKIKPNILFIPKDGEKNIYRAARNINKAKSLDPKSLNVYDLLNHKDIILDKEAVMKIEEHYDAIK